MTKKDRLPDGYVTPKTTDSAFQFGWSGGRGGYPRLSRQEFMSAGCDHPFPSSLYRAYRRGFTTGRKAKAKAKAKAKEGVSQ